MSPEQVKANLNLSGITITQWAKDNGYSRNEVYRVLNGVVKAKYGKAHEIAVKLGLKPHPAI
ncbi:MAG: DNA-binding protein [Pseudomonadota bacterium]|uniref:DNA-binding protein n=1 Tax=Providencia manganoxydans TaxID=2923283 RepID=UPI0034E43230